MKDIATLLEELIQKKYTETMTGIMGPVPEPEPLTLKKLQELEALLPKRIVVGFSPLLDKPLEGMLPDLLLKCTYRERGVLIPESIRVRFHTACASVGATIEERQIDRDALIGREHRI